MWELLEKIRAILDASDRRKAIIILINIFLVAILETAGVGLIIPLISLITTPTIENDGVLYNIFAFIGIENSGKQLILFVCVFLAVFYVAKNLFLVYSSYIQNRFRFNLQKKLSVKMLSAYMSRPYSFFVNTNSSEIMRGIGSDVGSVKDALEVVFNTLTNALTLVLLAVFLLYTDFYMAAVFLIVSFVCMYFLLVLLKKKVSVLGNEQRVAEAETTKYSYEMLGGIKDIYASRKQSLFLKRYDQAFDQKSKINIWYNTIIAMPNRVIEATFIIGLVLVIMTRVIADANMAAFLPKLAAFALAGIKILPSMSVVSKAVTQLIFQKPGVDATYVNVTTYGRDEITGILEESYEAVGFQELEFNNVSFNYGGNGDDVLKNVDLNIKCGDSVAFIGESGSGKTTLIDLILGLYSPTSGEIKINGKKSDDFKCDWRKLMAYVQQNVFLLDDTIRRNVAFGEPDDEIDDAKVWQSLEAAQLAGFVSSFEDGLDMIVGERGVKFSGGQRQRIAIARALYFDSDILIFDEATAALDEATEKAVMESIDSLHGKKTLIIVAHRLSTVKKCDVIYEVVNGELVSRTWDEIKN